MTSANRCAPTSRAPGLAFAEEPAAGVEGIITSASAPRSVSSSAEICNRLSATETFFVSETHEGNNQAAADATARCLNTVRLFMNRSSSFKLRNYGFLLKCRRQFLMKG